jgi:hypothetical protein
MPPGRAPVFELEWSDIGIIAVAILATLLLHPLQAMLGHPYWLDESWVAVLTRAPVSRLPRLSSSAPAGFLALLKLAPGYGLQRARLVVVAFAAMTVVVAYVLAFSLGWKNAVAARFAATVTAVVVMVAPLSLVRNDLKPYTCDAFCALLLIALAAWSERKGSINALVWLAVAAACAAPFSSTSLFVTVALFVGLLASAVLTGARRRIIEVLVVGGVIGGLLTAYFFAAVEPNVNDKLRAYWMSFYLNGSPFHVLGDLLSRLRGLGVYLGMPAFVFVALFVSGIVVLVRMGARAVAIALPVLWLEMLLLGRFHRYPFLDLRTSHFLLVSSLLVVAIGVVGLLNALRESVETAGSVLRSNVVVVGVGLTFLLVAFIAGFVTHVHELNIPNENIRAETLAVAELHRPHDVILVSSAANFGFSYYWPHGHLVVHDDDSGQGFAARVVGVNAIYAPSSSYDDILTSLRASVLLRQGTGKGTRLFIVRTHLGRIESSRWDRAFEAIGLHPRVDQVGVEPLLFVGPPLPRRS